jgi:hypothetical protein
MTPGIHEMSIGEYLALPALSSGTAHRVLSQSPAHALYARTEPTDQMDFGSLAHKLLLEDTEAGLCIVEADDWRTKAAKELRDSAREDNLIPVLSKHMPAVRAMVKAAREFVAQSEIAGVFDSGKPELSVLWQDCGDALWCKARPDWLNDKTILHYKTTQGSAAPAPFIRNQLFPMGYDIAAMFYERGLEKVTGKVRKSVFLVQEAYAPYACVLISLDPAAAEIAADKVGRAMAIWAHCRLTGKWPAYPPQIHYAEPLPWHLAQSEEQQTEEAVNEWIGGQA